jgi:hypothetical protein
LKTMLGEKSVSTSDLCKLLEAHLSVAQIKACGVEPFIETANGVYWRARDVPIIARAVARRLDALASSMRDAQ